MNLVEITRQRKKVRKAWDKWLEEACKLSEMMSARERKGKQR